MTSLVVVSAKKIHDDDRSAEAAVAAGLVRLANANMRNRTRPKTVLTETT